MSLLNKTKRWIEKIGAPSLQGKKVLITGANSGIGFKTAETMAYLGADIIMACRDRERGERARKKLAEEYPNVEITLMTLDLADFSSIDAFVRRIENDKTNIDVFVNNAGVFRKRGEKTADGLELVLGTNFFGVYYLCEQILPYLRLLDHEVVFVNTISIVYKIAKMDYDDFFYSKEYKDIAVYARSKLCLALYSRALAERLAENNVRIVMTHPGIALTPLGVNAYNVKPWLLNSVGKVFNSVEKSSLSLVYALAKDAPSGSIVGPNGLFGGWGYPKTKTKRIKGEEKASELIEFTESVLRSIKEKSKSF